MAKKIWYVFYAPQCRMSINLPQQSAEKQNFKFHNSCTVTSDFGETFITVKCIATKSSNKLKATTHKTSETTDTRKDVHEE